jgi:hypothetical protein
MRRSGRGGVCLPNAHLIPPASGFRCHYFWPIARNRQIDNEKASRSLQQVAQKIFTTEDIWMIEAQQRNIESVTNILSLRPVTLELDTPAVWAPRILANLIRSQAQGQRSEIAVCTCFAKLCRLPRSLRVRRKVATWDDDYLASLVAN